ncbi:MAG: gliding motility-associated C-terminal domain-containing protein [Marinirhabdus sp.]
MSFFTLGALNAQTVNTGELHIAPETILSTVSNFDNTPTATVINDGEFYVYADFNNDGTVDFTMGEEGRTRFQGSTVQELTGNTVSYFYDVLFDNGASPTASFELSSEVSVANNASFNEGIVMNDGFGGMVIFEDSANHTGVNDGSHVDGHVQKHGDDNFQFPIGDGQLFRFSAISAPDNAADAFTSKYYFTNPLESTVNGETPTADMPESIVLLDTAEFWTIINDSNTNDVLLTLSYDGATTTPEAIVASPQTSIHIVRWDEALQLWVDEGGMVDEDSRTVTTPLRLDSYGIFTLARVESGEDEEDPVTVYNGVTPNGDGINDYLLIEGVENLANNRVEVYNRWGVQVFGTDNYDNTLNRFDGFSTGRMSINNENDRLPTGTYYYILSYDISTSGNTERMTQAGFLYITTE